MTIQSSGATDSPWSPVGRLCLQFVLMGICATARADGDQASGVDSACARAEVLAHVQEQFRLYGPQSDKREFFGFIYRSEGVIQSSVVRGKTCVTNLMCSVDNAPAAKGIPPDAKVLGEWHTHPRTVGSRILSMADVLGAFRNRHIRCYTAYYSEPNGDIYGWDIHSDSVPVAMASRSRMGNYRDLEGGPAIIAAHQDPGTTCLSTNTSVHTAATTKKCCRKSPTSHSPSARAAGKRDCAS